MNVAFATLAQARSAQFGTRDDSRRIIRSTLPRAAPSAMSRFFGGLSVEEMAEVLPILRSQ